MSDVREDEKPCWETMNCPEYVRKKCPAYLLPEVPCWGVAYTQSEVLTSLRKDCTYCKVYHLCHESDDPGKPRA